MKKSLTGYKKNSKDKNEPILEIPGGNITMRNVPHEVLALLDNGSTHLMKPGKDYKFNTSKTIEIPMKKKQKGGLLKDFETYLSSLDEASQDSLLDYFDELDTDDQKRFLHGGRVAWEYQMGGSIPVEVEHNETILNPDGELYGFNGATHAQGGIDILAQPGAKIFSEYSKAPKELVKAVLGRDTKKKMSYADLSKKFDTTKYAKILDNPDMDEFAKNTAKLKMEGHRAMLETIFQAQEAEKVKENKGNKAQQGGTVSTQWDRTFPKGNMWSDFVWKDPTYGDKFVSREPLEQELGAFFDLEKISYPGLPVGTIDRDYKASDAVATPTFPWRSNFTKKVSNEILPPASTTLPVTIPDRGTKQIPTPSSKSSKRPDTSNNRSSQSRPFVFNLNDEEPPEVTLNDSTPVVSDRTSLVDYVTQERGDVEIPATATPPIVENKKKGKSRFGISDKLAGTVLDIGLALSDGLKVREPNYHDLRKTPLFSRFVEFDDKEAGRNLALNIQQIQNSNMPEEVKQARIADLNAQYKDHTAKVAFTNAQRYEQKLNQDTEKLQNYTNNNVDQHFQDVERYSQQKAHVDMLRDQFEAQRKSRVVNAVRGYLDYVNKTHLQNQILSENYRVNPITGQIDFKGNTPDALKKKEMEMQQYQQNAVPVKNLPNGAVLAKTPSGVEIIIDQTGKATIVK